MHRAIRILSLAVYLTLTACGGGGGGGGSTPAPPPPPPPNLNLAGITLSTGTLTPAFSAQTLSYTVVLDAATDTVDLTVTAADSASTVTVNGNAVASGVAGAVALPVGPSNITIAVNNGTASRTTTIVATRQDATPGTASITFPPAGLTDAATITVRGTAADPDTDIVAVSVNGVAATTTDGFATWTAAAIPLAAGDNDLNVSVENAGLALDAAAATVSVTQEPLLLGPRDIVLDESNNRALISDRISKAVIAVDLTSGALTELSGSSAGSGPAFELPTVIALDASRDRVLVGDDDADTLFAVDLTNGARSAFSATGNGTGPGWGRFYGVDTDTANDRLLVAALTQRDGLVAVDLDTGDRVVATEELYPGSIVGDVAEDVANNQVITTDTLRQVVAGVNLDGVTGADIISSFSARGAGPRFGVPAGVLLDNANSRLLVTDSWLSAVFDVDLATGDRTILSDATNGTGPEFSRPVGIVNDDTNGRVLVIDSVLDAAITLDPASGNRAILGQTSFGNGPSLDAPLYFDVDAANGRLVVVDAGLNTIVVADLASRDRTEAASEIIVGVPRSARQVTVDSANNFAFYAGGSSISLLYSADLATGTLRIASGTSTGTGPDFLVSGLTYDAVNERIIASDEFGVAVLGIDPATGNRFSISRAASNPLGEPGVGTGPNFSLPRGLALDFVNDRVLVADDGRNAIIAADLISGDRTIISDDTTGTGASLSRISGIGLDSTNNRVLVAEFFPPSIVAVDLTSGSRSYFSDNAGAASALDAAKKNAPIR